MAVFLLRISFRNQPSGSDFLLTGRVYPPTAIVKAGDWLLFGEVKVLIKQVVTTDYQGIMLTIGQDSVETLRRSGMALTRFYGTEIPLGGAAP
jgi:hypothetical protein